MAAVVVFRIALSFVHMLLYNITAHINQCKETPSIEIHLNNKTAYPALTKEIHSDR